MTDLVPNRDPWSQHPDESNADYAAFVEYCKLGVRRSTRVLAMHLGTSAYRLNKIAKENDWTGRADLYDKSCNELVPSADNLSMEDTLAFQAAVGKAMLDIGLSALQLKTPATIRTTDIVKLLTQGSEIQRKAMGITDTISVKVESDAVQTINNMLDELIGEVISEEEDEAVDDGE